MSCVSVNGVFRSVWGVFKSKYSACVVFIEDLTIVHLLVKQSHHTNVFGILLFNLFAQKIQLI